MITVRPSDERGHVQHGWLDTRHSFSFGDYYAPDHMGFGPLRVINEDHVAPGAGFGMHPHANMEILTFVLEGGLEHKDSLGNGSVIRPGDVQRMSAGTGIRHAEMNPSKDKPVHLLQIWLLPEAEGLDPGYEQKAFAADERRGGLRLIAARDGRDGAVTIHQDVDLYTALLDEGDRVTHALGPGRIGWLQLARGEIVLNGTTLRAGDGAAITQEDGIEVSATAPAELLFFDMTPSKTA